MATSEQIKSLIRAHIDCDNIRFKTITLQIAAYEAKIGHTQFAREIKRLADGMANSKNNVISLGNVNPMLSVSAPTSRLSDLVVSNEITMRIERVLNEYRNQNRLKKYGLQNRRKILIEGNPGTGKTFTASIIASELNLPLFSVQMDKVVTKFMGETSVKLRQIFDSISSTVGVYFFDEFDAIGADRSLDNEVGEARRILNSFLQYIEQDESRSIIIAATNNQKLLDQALFRRFDDVLHYVLPTASEISRLFEKQIVPYDKSFHITSRVIELADGLSQAEIIHVCDDAIKNSILYGNPINEKEILSLITERKNAYLKEA
ncbi:MAG: ATP-binding protein [Ruminococcus sp.]|nr:ATP-binding protein [Ruminococcus sp.]